MSKLTADRISGTGFGKGHRFAVTASGLQFGTINDTASTFELENQTFSIIRTGIASPQLRLTSGDEPIATAVQKPLRNCYTLTLQGKEWTFKAISLLATTFGLFEAGKQTGAISSGPFLNRLKGITADLPDELPPPIQMFLLSIFIGSLTTPAD